MRSVVFALLVVAACDSNKPAADKADAKKTVQDPAQETCEHAREVVMAYIDEDVQGAIAYAPEDARERLAAEMKAQAKASREVFIDECKALDEVGLGCMARIDELFAIDKEMVAARDACPKGESGFRDQDCLAKVTATRDEKVGACTKEIVSGFMASLHKSAKASLKSREF